MEIVRVYFKGYIDQPVFNKPANSHDEAKRVVGNKLNAEKVVFEFTGTDNPADYEN